MNTRLVFVDCLRGVAICGVVLVHCGQLVSGLPDGLAAFADYGGKGVQLFFVLSALTLMSVHANRPFMAGPFFIRRFFRLAPIFYLAVIFYLLQNGTEPDINAPDGIGVRQIMLTLTFLHGWMFDSINSVVPGGWSIADEAMFYLLFPVLLRSLTTGKRAVLALLVAVIVSRLSYVLIPVLFAGTTTPELARIFAGFCFPTQLPAFIAGFVVYFFIRGQPSTICMRYYHIGFFAVSFMLIGCAASGNKSLSNYLLADMLFIPFVAGVYVTQPPMIVNRPLRHIGLVSYSIYIVHFALIHWCRLYILPHMQSIDAAVQLAILYGVVLLASTMISTITFRYVELPMIRLGRRFSAQPDDIALAQQ